MTPEARRQAPAGEREPAVGKFPSTHWTLVFRAGGGSSAGARQSFGELYETYRPALLAFLRRSTGSEQESQDALQGFFESLLEKGGLARVRRGGKFRSWLLVALKNYRQDQWDRARAKKRGGGQLHLRVGLRSEDGVAVEPTDPARTPEQEFERRYALAFLRRVLLRVKEDYELLGKAEIFRQLRPWLLDKKGAVPQVRLARELGMKENTLNSEVSRLRKYYRRVFDEELMNLVGSREELEAEKQFLFKAVTN